MKKIIQIVGVVLFFSIVAFIITYPFELAYKGEEGIVLVNESYEFTSLEQVTNRPEFKNKVLYIRAWEPLKHEFYYYNINKTQKVEDSLKKLSEGVAFNFHSKPLKIKSVEEKKTKQINVISFEQELAYLVKMQKDYENKNLAVVFLTSSDSEFNKKEDNIRKWKAIIKKHKIKGYHFVLSPKFEQRLITKIKVLKGNKQVFPHNFIINKKGNITNSNAPSPSFEKEILYLELDSILKQ